MVQSILIVSPNWLGDAVMAMPAVHRFRSEHPQAQIVVLAKPGVAALWRMHDSPDEVIELRPGNGGTFAAARSLRARKFSQAIILPNSFRSALIPFLAGILKRRGTAFHARGLMINDRVSLAGSSETGVVEHQAREYFQILCGSPDGVLADTGFRPPKAALLAELNADADTIWVGIIPGAARGASKRWPYFAQAANHVLRERSDVRFVVAGSAGEALLCAEVAAAIGEQAVSIAGRTNLTEFAALLSGCRLVMCNDSGGMHLASAAGVPVVAVYGVTDAAKTGPIGANAVVICAEGVQASRKVPRESALAEAALASIRPERVAAACLALLNIRSTFDHENRSQDTVLSALTMNTHDQALT